MCIYDYIILKKNQNSMHLNIGLCSLPLYGLSVMSQKCFRNRLMSLLVCINSQVKFSCFRALASEMSNSTLFFLATPLGFQSIHKGKLELT